jgi:hypothetical protein
LDIINFQAHKFYNLVFNSDQLKEALKELRSAQLIIKLLQEELNMTLVVRSEHNHRYEVPCTTQRSRESTTNIECIPATKNGWSPINSSHFVKPKRYAEYGNMPTSKRIKTSNCFEPLSDNGNRNNAKLKPDNFKESESKNFSKQAIQ